MLVYVLGALLLFTSIIMILLVLIQRGRGGGLAGAFGGQGGQSALGVRAGDVFTKITVVMAVSWVLLAGVLGISMRSAAEAEVTGANIEGADLLADDPEEETTDGEDGDDPAIKTAEEDPAEAEAPADKPEAEGDAGEATETEQPATSEADASEEATDGDSPEAPEADDVKKPADEDSDSE